MPQKRAILCLSRMTHSGPPPSSHRPPRPGSSASSRWVIASAVVVFAVFAYYLRQIIAPLLFAFVIATVLDPFVSRLERLKLPRSLASLFTVVAIFGGIAAALVFSIPVLISELTEAGAALPDQLLALQRRSDPWLWTTFHVRLPHTFSEVARTIGDRLGTQLPTMIDAAVTAFFGTIGVIAVLLSALIVPLIVLYFLITYQSLLKHVDSLVPRRWEPLVVDLGRQTQRTLYGYFRGQITANIILGALYAAALRFVDIRLAVPIGVLTGMLTFIPYIGFSIGFFLALTMSILDWHGFAPVIEVVAMMGAVQLLDATVVTPRIVGRSVGLTPIEVIFTLMVAGSVFGFLGVLMAVPIGAVIKLIAQRVTRVYLASDFYLERAAVSKRH